MAKRKALAATLDAALLLAMLGTIWHVSRSPLFRADPGETKLVHVGQHMDIPVGEPGNVQLVYLLSSTCRACMESTAELRTLSDAADHAPRVSVTVLALEGDEEETRQWLDRESVRYDRFLAFSELGATVLGFYLTPTLLLLDEFNVVTDLVVGRLDSVTGSAIAERLQDPEGTTPLNATNSLREIDQPQYVNLRRQNARLQVIDIRERAAYSQEHLVGAVNLPFDELLRAEFELSRDAGTVIDCGDAARFRCHTAGALLEERGFEDVVVLVR